MSCIIFFFFNDTATTEIYTLSLHDALPICQALELQRQGTPIVMCGRYALKTHAVLPDNRGGAEVLTRHLLDRKSTRLNSSHQIISYAVFCLKKKKRNKYTPAHNISPEQRVF